MSAPPPPTFRVGDMIAGKYRVEKVLGVGGMGIVLAAKHVELHEVRAIKLMLHGQSEQPDAVERFLREARAAVRIKSEHVAKVYDVGRLEDGSPYMVMEYLKGDDLKAIMKARGPLPLADAVTCVLEACEAIAEAHAAGIVHRDLKPANLFVTTGSDGLPSTKVLDFGISKLLPALGSEPGQDITKTSAILGSPLYMSPEQMRSTRDVDARADIWALGVILYQLTTGVVPFKAEALTQLCALVLLAEAVPPSEQRSGLPVAFDAVVLRCLAKKAEERYGNVAELALDLLPFGAEGARVSVDRITRTLGVSVSPPRTGSDSGQTPVPTPDLPAEITSLSDDTAASWRHTGAIGARKSPSRMRVVVLGASAAAIGVAALVARGRDPAPSFPGAAAVVQSAASVSSSAGDVRPVLSAGEPAPVVPTAIAPIVAPVAVESPSAIPSVSAARLPLKTARPRTGGSAPVPLPPVGKANCNPPFTVDADGVKHAKPECL